MLMIKEHMFTLILYKKRNSSFFWFALKLFARCHNFSKKNVVSQRTVLNAPSARQCWIPAFKHQQPSAREPKYVKLLASVEVGLCMDIMMVYLSLVSIQWKTIVFLLLLCPKHKRLMLLISMLQLPHNLISGDAAKGNVRGETNTGFITSYAETDQWWNIFLVAALFIWVWCSEASRHYVLQSWNPERFKGRCKQIWQ